MTKLWQSILRTSSPIVTSAANGNISAFTINPVSGALKKVKGSPFGDAGSIPLGISVCRVTAGKCIPAAL